MQVALKKTDAVTTPVGKPYRSLESARKFAESIVERDRAYDARVTDESGLTLFRCREDG